MHASLLSFPGMTNAILQVAGLRVLRALRPGLTGVHNQHTPAIISTSACRTAVTHCAVILLGCRSSVFTPANKQQKVGPAQLKTNARTEVRVLAVNGQRSAAAAAHSLAPLGELVLKYVAHNRRPAQQQYGASVCCVSQLSTQACLHGITEHN